MEEDIEAIFLDTNVFENAKFTYKNNNFMKLIELCKEHDIPIYIDYIVEQEVLHRISENIQKTIDGLKKDKLYYLSQIYTIHDNTKEIQKTLSDKLIKDFQELKDEHILILDNDVLAIEVAKMYFNNEAPFEKGRKKYEFPDAIIGLNIKNYIEEEFLNILTITNDNGLISFFENSKLPVVNMLSRAVNIINKQFQTDTYFSEIKDNIKSDIISYIKEGNIELNIYAYDYQDTVYVNEYDITEVILQELLLINRDNSYGVLTVSCPCNIIIECTTDYYPDYENGIFDKEDHNWCFFNSKRTTHRIEEEIEVTFELSEIPDNGKELFIDYSDRDIDIEFDLYNDWNLIKEEYIESSE